MARLNVISNIAAGAVFDPLASWQYRYAPFNGRLTIWQQQNVAVAPTLATDVLLATITSGSDTLMEESPIQLINVALLSCFQPTPQHCIPLVDDVAAGDLIKVKIRNSGAGAQDYALVIDISPL